MDDPVFGGLLTEISEELAPFKEKVVRREEVLCALALARQKRIGAANRAIERRHVEGIGEMVAQIDADVYHRLGMIHGYQTVRDPDLLRILLRDNPDIRVTSKSSRVTIRVVRDYREVDVVDRVDDVDTEAQGIEAGEIGEDAA